MSLDNVNKSAGILWICMDFLRKSAVETLTFYALSVCKKMLFNSNIVFSCFSKGAITTQTGSCG